MTSMYSINYEVHKELGKSLGPSYSRCMVTQDIEHQCYQLLFEFRSMMYVSSFINPPDIMPNLRRQYPELFI